MELSKQKLCCINACKQLRVTVTVTAGVEQDCGAVGVVQTQL